MTKEPIWTVELNASQLADIRIQLTCGRVETNNAATAARYAALLEHLEPDNMRHRMRYTKEA